MEPRLSAWLLATALLLSGCASAPSGGDAAAPDVATARPDERATSSAEAPIPSTPRVVQLDGIRVHVDEGFVELDAVTCLDAGWLEQIACTPGSRDHESLVVVPARPSDVHAALLLAGFEHGTPGRWTYENEVYSFVAPVGERLRLLVRRPAGDGGDVTEPISSWVADDRAGEPFPDEPWVFGGSALRSNPAGMGPGEHYVADMTGSVIGLVTFGDEVIGFSKVIADESEVAAPQWVVDTDRVPPMGTEVTIVIRRFD